jgi:predicted glutamine amidotransferase
MCELFCLSTHRPTRSTFSLRHFAAHGTPAGRNVDGWGVAFHEGRDARLYKEPEPAGDSPLLGFIERHLHPTRLLISHIRRATRGGRSLANTQPFARELGGRVHLFAHNGDLAGIDSLLAASAGRFHPVGDTDSERGFCLLLDHLATMWEGTAPPSLDARLAAVTAFAARMRPLGIANFLYSDGEFVFAHGHRRTQADGAVAPPGLWVRHRRRAGSHATTIAPPAASGVTVHAHPEATDNFQEMALFASVPVTGGRWSPLAEGEIVVVSAGELVERAPTLSPR